MLSRYDREPAYATASVKMQQQRGHDTHDKASTSRHHKEAPHTSEHAKAQEPGSQFWQNVFEFLLDVLLG